MRRTVFIVALMAAILAGGMPGPRAQSRGAASRGEVTLTCAAVLGAGVKTHRDFCDVLIASTVADSVAISLPAHTGPATLTFELHNRFTVPPPIPGPAVLAYARHEAVVSVVTAVGDVIGRALVRREFRTDKDLFDHIEGGAAPGGVKAVAPGPPEKARVVIPAGVREVGIVGARLKVLTRAGGEQLFDTPGRPVAIVSNVQVDFRR